jgi:hypothetical protein
LADHGGGKRPQYQYLCAEPPQADITASTVQILKKILRGGAAIQRTIEQVLKLKHEVTTELLSTG